MASGGAIRAGRAFVEAYLEDGKLQSQLRSTQARLKVWGNGITSIGAKVFAFGATASAAFAPAIAAASDMQETVSKFETVFGAAAASVRSWGDEYASAVGRSKKQVVDFLASSQDLFVPLGFAADAAEDLSKQVTQLAVDLASFNNKSDDDVLRDLHAALTGSGEVMKKYGVIVSEAAVKQELLNMQLDPKLATETQKAMARLNIIMRGTTAAQGDALRTSGSFANQMKRLRATIDDAAVALGTALLPVLTPMVNRVSTLVQRFAAWAEQNPETAATIFKVAAGATAAGVALIALGQAVSFAATLLGGLHTVVTVFPLMISGIRTATVSFAAMGVSASAAWAAATAGISLLVTALLAVGTTLIALGHKFGIFDPAIEVIRELADRIQKRLQPVMERLGVSVGKVFETMKPLVPLIELSLVAAVESLAFVLEHVVIPQVEAFVASLRLALSLASAIGSPALGAVGVSFGGGTSSADSSGDDLGSVPDASDPDLTDLQAGTDAAAGAPLSGVFSEAFEEFARQTAEATMETARNTRRMLDRGGVTYQP